MAELVTERARHGEKAETVAAVQPGPRCPIPSSSIQSSIRHYAYPVRHWESASADFSFKSATMESQIIQEFRPSLDARHEQVIPGPRAGEET